MASPQTSVLDAAVIEQLTNNVENNQQQAMIEMVKLLSQINSKFDGMAQTPAKSEPSSDTASNKWAPPQRQYKGFKEELRQGFQGNLKKELGVDEFADSIRTKLVEATKGQIFDLKDIPSSLGKSLSTGLANSLKKNNVTSGLAQKLGKAGTDLAGALGNGVSGLAKAASEGQGLGSMLKIAGSAAAEAGPALAALGPAVLAVGAAMLVLEKVTDALGPAIEGTKALFEATSKAANRAQASAAQNLELAQQRLTADMNAYIQEPFDILKESAEEVYQAWDNTMSKITASQGYTKADLQDLMSVYAQRLRSEGLTSYVSGADITENLSKVLEAGLSGQVAEEFAYLATKLGAAVPTQDFFSYASTYASIAANAIKNGESQEAAIQYANEELESFASNVLYASRQLAGGFSTGLSDASSILQDAVRIATASKTGEASNISGVLTSVAAITGAIAPDLASQMVSTVVDAALGGNSSNYTALRSLSGTGASNTAFLNALATSPQQVFATLFRNLGNMQTMSNGNFMEVAEGLADVFGVSMEAFARVDFNYLAQAISQMNVENSALDENMALLVSGQTTSTAEQLRMQQINEYMLEEGLSYVLDNEVARSVQEHMWEEQMQRELMEATYGVELQGAALEFLQGISQTVENIINFLNPFSWVKKLGNVVQTNKEGKALEADLLAMLQKGNIGKANQQTLYNLTTRDKRLNLASNYLSLLGGNSQYASARQNTLAMQILTGQSSSVLGAASNFGGSGGLSQLFSFENNGNAASGVTSRYAWNTVGKSVSSYLADTASSAGGSRFDLVSASATMAGVANTKFESFLDTMEKYVEDNKTYDEWKASAKRYGISDFDTALGNYGLTETDLQYAFQAQEASKASAYTHQREVNEDYFWELGTAFWDSGFPDFENTLFDYQDMVIEREELMLNELDKGNKQLTDFFNEWIDYYVNHTAYTQSTLNAYDVAAIRNAEKDETGDAVLALANALTSNNLDLKDPVVQQNVLLSQILLTVQSIMEQNNNTSTVSLPTALSALGLGITNS